MRVGFEEQLTQLNNELLEMGALIEQGINGASKALKNQDMEMARKTIEVEHEVDKKERDIETLCLRLLLKQQPVAGDLRLISAALKMITDMERIGDQAADISEIVISLNGESYIKKLEHLPLMAEAAKNMVSASIDAFVNNDLELARSVADMDNEIDDLFDIIKNELIKLIREDASNGSQAVNLLMIAKYFEKIGDHAQNISEWVEYSLTGVHKGTASF